MDMNEIESSGSESQISESTESQSEGSDTGQETAATREAAPKHDETPFHEHPRFKELVEQKNAALQSTRALELKLAQLEGRIQATASPKAQAEKDELIEDLRKIDPRLASRFESLAGSAKTLEQLQAKLEALENGSKQSSQQAVVKESVSRINGWHEANKVPNEIKQAVNSRLDVLYMTGKLNQQNLEAEYKKAYEPYKAFVENLKRESLKGYVQDKRQDTKVPASLPKGSPAKAKPPEVPKFRDRDELRAAVAKEYVQNQIAKRSASSV